MKTCEPAGDTFIAHRQTATSRGAAHRFLEQTYSPGQYTMPAHQPGAPRLWLLTLRVVSVRGALGSGLRGTHNTFIRQTDLCPGGGGGALPATRARRARPRTAVLPSSALQSPSLLAGRLLLASVGAPALCRGGPAFRRGSAPTAGSAPTRRAASIAQSTRLLLSSDLVAYCGSLVA